MSECVNTTVKAFCGLIPADSVDVHVMMTIGNSGVWVGYKEADYGSLSKDDLWGNHLFHLMTYNVSGAIDLRFVDQNNLLPADNVGNLAIMVPAFSGVWTAIPWTDSSKSYRADGQVALAQYFADNIGSEIHLAFKNDL